MYPGTHAGVGALCGLIVGNSLGFVEQDLIVCVGVSMIGALLCDIDQTNSTIQKIIPFRLGNIIGWILPHRGKVTHSMFFILLMCSLAFVFLPTILLLPFGLGILTHLLLDCLNPSGLPLFYPITSDIYRSSMFVIRSGGLVDKFILTPGVWIVFFHAASMSF